MACPANGAELEASALADVSSSVHQDIQTVADIFTDRGEKEKDMQNNDKREDTVHELWLIYCQLKDAEANPAATERLVGSARERLGHLVNALNRDALEPKSPRNKAANLNCRDRPKGLTLDTG